jgi:DNA mismatch repair ATPase MutL
MMRNDRSRIFTILGSSKSSGAIIRTLSSSHSFQPFPPSPSTSTFTHVSESSTITTATSSSSSSSSTSGGSMSTGNSNNDNSGKSSSSNNSSSSGSSSNSSSKNRNDVSNNKQMSGEMKEMNEMNEMDNEMEWWKWPNGGYPFSLYFECLSTGSSFNRSQVSYLLPYLTLPSLLYIYNMQRTR